MGQNTLCHNRFGRCWPAREFIETWLTPPGLRGASEGTWCGRGATISKVEETAFSDPSFDRTPFGAAWLAASSDDIMSWSSENDVLPFVDDDAASSDAMSCCSATDAMPLAAIAFDDESKMSSGVDTATSCAAWGISSSSGWSDDFSKVSCFFGFSSSSSSRGFLGLLLFSHFLFTFTLLPFTFTFVSSSPSFLGLPRRRVAVIDFLIMAQCSWKVSALLASMASLSSRNSDRSSGSKSSNTNSSHSFPTSAEISWSASLIMTVFSSSIPIFCLIAFKISGSDIRFTTPRFWKLMLSLKAINNVVQSLFSTFFINLSAASSTPRKNSVFFFEIKNAFLFEVKKELAFLWNQEKHFCSRKSFHARSKSEGENILLQFVGDIWTHCKKQAQTEWHSTPVVCRYASNMQIQWASRRKNFLLQL